MGCCNSDNVKKMGLLYLFLSILQFTFTIYSMTSPYFIVGNITVARVESFANRIPTMQLNESFTMQLNESVQLGDYVEVGIGIFETIINGSTSMMDNREGLKVVLGFLILSVIHSFSNILYSFNIAFPNLFACCCNNCDTCCECVRKTASRIRELAKKSFSTSVDSILAAALFDFTAEYKFGIVDYGASFFILLPSITIGFIQGAISLFQAGRLENKSSANQNSPGINLKNIS